MKTEYCTVCMEPVTLSRYRSCWLHIYSNRTLEPSNTLCPDSHKYHCAMEIYVTDEMESEYNR